MFIDGLPIWGFIGKVEKLPGKEGEQEREKLSLFTHVSGGRGGAGSPPRRHHSPPVRLGACQQSVA